MENPLTLVEYSEQELCPGCRDLPPVNSFRHYQHIIHDTFKSFLACPCPFCIWLHKAQDSHLSPDDRHSLLEQNSVVALHPNLSIIPQTINLGDSMSNVGVIDGQIPHLVTEFFHVFTDPCDPCSKSIRGREPLQPRSDQAFEAINRSIENCMSNHESCQSPAEAYLPSYIVDVNPPGQQECRLVRTSGKEKGRYAALSYVWGVPLSEQPVYLSRDSEEKLRRGIPEAELPPTLKDTVHVLRKLRIRYLWVDALCIVQDDDAIKRVEIGKMHNIFGNAFLTIQASRAKSIREGFLHERPSPSLPRQKLRYNDASSQQPAFIYMRAAPVTYQEGAVGTRAWCFEEGVLSRRVLQYGPECTTYDCFSGRQSDNGMWDKQGTYTSSGPTFFYPGPWYRGSRVPNDERVNDPRMNILIRWYTALDYHYTPRFLTKERDRLAAIAGVARRIKADIGGEFLAGLWSSDMLWGLMWSTRLGLGVKFVNRDIAEEWRGKWGPRTMMVRPKAENRAPSWSWASVDGPTHYDISKRRSIRPQTVAEVLQYPKPKAGGYPGELDDYRLVLSASVRLAWLVVNEVAGRREHLGRLTGGTRNLVEENGKHIAHARLDIDDDVLERVWCVLIFNSMGLLLVPSGGESESFRRVGVFFPLVPWDVETKTEICIQ